MFGILLLLFTVLPAIEVYLLIKIGSQIGGLNTLSIILVTGFVGAILAKSQGLSVLTKIQKQLAQGQLPATELGHGLLIFAGGLLLLTPGFLTDFFGFSMVIPITRHLIYFQLKNILQKSINNGNVHIYTQNYGFSKRPPKQQNDQNIIDAEFTKKND